MCRYLLSQKNFLFIFGWCNVIIKLKKSLLSTSIITIKSVCYMDAYVAQRNSYAEKLAELNFVEKLAELNFVDETNFAH